MIITEVRVTPMMLPLKTPYVWSQGVEDVFCVNLIELVGEDGSTGIGETTTAPDAGAQAIILRKIGAHFVGRSVFEATQIIAEAYRSQFWCLAGTCHVMPTS